MTELLGINEHNHKNFYQHSRLF